MKRIIGLCLLLSSCTEKTEISMKVMRDKAEDRLVKTAGEGEVTIEMFRLQYATFKERLVRLKTIESMTQESLDQAHANNDPRRIAMYTKHLQVLKEKIPTAERALKEFYEIMEHQKNEIRMYNEQTSTYTAINGVHQGSDAMALYERRGDMIKRAMTSLKQQSHRAQMLMDVNDIESTFNN